MTLEFILWFILVTVIIFIVGCFILFYFMEKCKDDTDNMYYDRGLK